MFTVKPGIVYTTPTGGTAYLGAHQPLDRQPRGFAYAFPANAGWIDANGTTQDGSNRPPCVPYYHAVRVKSMEAVIYPIGDTYEGTVLWVHC